MATKSDLRNMTFRGAQRYDWVRRGHGLTVFAGENGVGKSRLLQSIAKSINDKGMSAIAISNTTYSNFPRVGRNVKRLLSSSRVSLPERTLKDAIISAELKDELALRQISRIFRYCGYGSDLGVQVMTTLSKWRGRAQLDELESLSEDDRKEILALCELIISGRVSKEIFWYGFDGYSPDYSFRSHVPKLIKWESVLKSIGFISSIKLYLEKDGGYLPLRYGSSGEKSLIATLSFIAAAISDCDFILIDEPENSLHPRWQRGYIDLLMSVVRYREVSIFIATHSPLVVSELDSGDYINGRSEVVVLGQTPFRSEEKTPVSVEGILTEVFHTVTPRNHYLSEALVDLLDEVERDRSSLDRVKSKIQDLKSAGTDQAQLQALEAVEIMASEIVSGEKGG